MEITEKNTSQSQNCCCKANEKFEIDDAVEQAYRQGYQKGYKDADKSITIQNLRKIANHYGFVSQADMLCEESGEFITARNKIRRGDYSAIGNLNEELADIIVVALQLRHLLGEKTIDDIIESKISRQLKRIEGEDHE